MKNAALSVFKKEMMRFFGDRRLVFTTLIMPGLLIFVIYSVMGQAMSSMLENDESSAYSVSAVNMPASAEKLFTSDTFDIKKISADKLESEKEKLSEKKRDLCIVFPENFDNAVLNFNPADSDRDIPNVEIYYNSTSITSGYAYDSALTLLNQFETAVSNVFDINGSVNTKYDVATEADTTGSMFASILPMLLMVLLFSSCMQLAPESIAGEKERGTIATLLITPAPRGQIAMGKILALSCIALLSGLSSFLGTYLSMPALLGEMSDEISTQCYVFTDYLWLIIMILSTVILFVTLISILSAFAKTVKEAATFVSPLMIIIMLVSFASMYSTTCKEELYWYLIPVYNSVQSMIGIFSFTAVSTNLVASALSNVAYSLIGVFVLTKMFNSEKVMFSR